MCYYRVGQLWTDSKLQLPLVMIIFVDSIVQQKRGRGNLKVQTHVLLVLMKNIAFKFSNGRWLYKDVYFCLQSLFNFVESLEDDEDEDQVTAKITVRYVWCAGVLSGYACQHTRAGSMLPTGAQSALHLLAAWHIHGLIINSSSLAHLAHLAPPFGQICCFTQSNQADFSQDACMIVFVQMPRNGSRALCHLLKCVQAERSWPRPRVNADSLNRSALCGLPGLTVLIAVIALIVIIHHQFCQFWWRIFNTLEDGHPSLCNTSSIK